MWEDRLWVPTDKGGIILVKKLKLYIQRKTETESA